MWSSVRCEHCGQQVANSANRTSDKGAVSGEGGEEGCWSKFKNAFGHTKYANKPSLTEIPTNVCTSGEIAKYSRRPTVQFSLEVNSRSYDRNDSITDEKVTYVKRASRNSILSKSKKSTSEGYRLTLHPINSVLKLLLVFLGDDNVAESIKTSADKLGFETTHCLTTDAALDEFQQTFHDLVVVDARNTTNFDNETLCRSIRNTKGAQHTVVVGVVKRSIFEKDDGMLQILLDVGYNRCIAESTNVVVCLNELIQLKHSEIKRAHEHASTQLVYTALDRCRDLVHITDENSKVRYINRAAEKHLLYKHDELIGKPITEVIADSSYPALQSALARGRDWEGSMQFRRKNQEPVHCVVKGVPVSCYGRLPTHFVIISEYNLLGPEAPPQSAVARGSINSLRRGSMDVRSTGSDFLRRTSLAKLSALPLEAPITRIISLIAAAQELSNIQVVQILDKVVDLLRCTELYSPNVKEERIKTDEPVASDLIGALLSQHPPGGHSSSRRSSNDSTVIRASRNHHKFKMHHSKALEELLERSLTWEFDIFRLEEITNKRPLVHLGMNIFQHFDVANIFNCDEKTLYNWLTVIEVNYHSDNSYHNSTHAADVLQATAGFLEKERMKSLLDNLDEATSLIAACAHDVDHPGKSSAFLSNADNPLAILYNDITVLESHHAALTFKLTLGDHRVNIFKNMERDMYKLARQNVVDMILATEMTKHFEHLAKFVNVFCTKPASNSTVGEMENQEDYVPLSLPENITLVKRMMIKCADVSNPTRPLRQCVEWARRIAEEYFMQTDEEIARNLPIMMPMFDKTTCSIPKSQIGFIDYIINDMIEAWDAFIDMPELVTYMRQNYVRWKEFDEKGFTTLSDMKQLQKSPSLSPFYLENS